MPKLILPKLYSYCITYDDGIAPNPYWDICTLNICKPVIRRTAAEGSWIVATGSMKNNFQNKVVYAMEITKILTMEKYYNLCKTTLFKKIPIEESDDLRERLGDCIYDFDKHPAQNISSHIHRKIEEQERDLRGENTLLSEHFYYFGGKPLQLPHHLLPIVNQGQGHKSTSNQGYYDEFVEWIQQQTHAKNKIYADPKDNIPFTTNGCAKIFTTKPPKHTC